MPSLHDTPRRIHLDFHTPELDFRIAEAFDSELFARTVAEAGVDEITVFAKCAYGYAYYATELGYRHPNLARDLMGEQLEALHRHGVQAMVHYSVGLDEMAWRTRPEWRQIQTDGGFYTRRSDYWGYLCPSSGYPAEKCVPELEEIARQYPIDGVFLDVIRFEPGTCFCANCRRAVQAEFGVELTREWAAANAALWRAWQVGVMRDMLASFSQAVKAHRPNALMVSNSHAGWVGEDRRLAEPIDYLIIEASPSRDLGYGELSMHARHARTLGKPAEIMTRRFLHIWGDFMLKPVAQLKFEAATIFANGASMCFGDHLYPEGRLEPAAYQAMGEVYRWVGERLHLGPAAEPVADIALFAPNLDAAARGADRLLAEAHAAFDIIDRPGLAGLAAYQALVVPEGAILAADDANTVRSFVDRGGGLLVAGAAWQPELGDILGAAPGPPAHFSALYLYPSPEIRGAASDMPLLLSTPSAPVRLRGAAALAQVAYPLFERTPERFFSHRYAPPGSLIAHPVLTEHRYGRGRAVLAAFDLFRMYWEQNQWFVRRAVAGVLNRMIARPAMRVDASPSVEATLMRRDGALLLHLVHFHGERPTGGSYAPIESIPFLHDVPVAIRTEAAAAVTLEPGGQALPFQVRDGYVHTVVPVLDIHAAVRVR